MNTFSLIHKWCCDIPSIWVEGADREGVFIKNPNFRTVGVGIFRGWEVLKSGLVITNQIREFCYSFD